MLRDINYSYGLFKLLGWICSWQTDHLEAGLGSNAIANYEHYHRYKIFVVKEQSIFQHLHIMHWFVLILSLISSTLIKRDLMILLNDFSCQFD